MHKFSRDSLAILKNLPSIRKSSPASRISSRSLPEEKSKSQKYRLISTPSSPKTTGRLLLDTPPNHNISNKNQQDNLKRRNKSDKSPGRKGKYPNPLSKAATIPKINSHHFSPNTEMKLRKIKLALKASLTRFPKLVLKRNTW